MLFIFLFGTEDLLRMLVNRSAPKEKWLMKRRSNVILVTSHIENTAVYGDIMTKSIVIIPHSSVRNVQTDVVAKMNLKDTWKHMTQKASSSLFVLSAKENTNLKTHSTTISNELTPRREFTSVAPAPKSFLMNLSWNLTRPPMKRNLLKNTLIAMSVPKKWKIKCLWIYTS